MGKEQVTMESLLYDLAQNQKDSNKNQTKIFLAVIFCYTALLITMVVGFFLYESQFETVDSTYTYEQEADVDGESGTAIVNGSGDFHYAPSEDQSNNKN